MKIFATLCELFDPKKKLLCIIHVSFATIMLLFGDGSRDLRNELKNEVKSCISF